MKRISLLLALMTISVSSMGQMVLDKPLSERVTGYNIDVELLPEKKMLNGKVQAYWVNISGEIVADVQLHLYLNAFRSNKSTYYKERGGSPGPYEIDYGWVEINSIYDSDGNDLSSVMSYIQPDDENEHDMTVLKIDLPEPAQSGDTIWLNIDFTSKLPSKIRRTGFSENYYFVAQWFPKFGVYEPVGMRHTTESGWNCHQFHNKSEFYANHSVYDVSITLPTEYVVGSGGMLIRQESMGDNLKKVVYRAEDIVDFAWTAWPDYKVAEDEWGHINIKFLYPPGRENQIDRQLQAMKYALEYLTQRVGPFPWPHITLVDPPIIGKGASGMEYTTFFTSAGLGDSPGYDLEPERVTVHELCHAYFMGMIASNEAEEPWLDEGINSYYEARIMDHYYGPGLGKINLGDFGLSDKEWRREAYVISDDKQVVDNTPVSWDYPHDAYKVMSYSKAATIMWTLHGIIGEETIDEVFREYYRCWAFDHPSGQDFIDVTNHVVSSLHGNKFGENMNWFFDQTLFSTGICDYELDGISNNIIQSFSGIVESDMGMVFEKNVSDDIPIYNSEVRIQRLGEVMLPLEILVHFESGKEVLETWNGKARHKTFLYKDTDQVLWADIDPERKIALDINYLNNYHSFKPDMLR